MAQNQSQTLIHMSKVLYDAEYERSKITLIQAVLLMSFWYADTEDRTGPWHWIGVAIGLCQTIGLHRNPDLSPSYTKSIPPHDGRLWRQIWWSCFYREVWFSVGMGRPMRIRLVDCDTPMPDAYILGGEIADITTNTRRKYLPDGARELSLLWERLLELTVTLSDILLQQQRASQAIPSQTETEHVEARIRTFYDETWGGTVHSKSQTVSLHAHHLAICIE